MTTNCYDEEDEDEELQLLSLLYLLMLWSDSAAVLVLLPGDERRQVLHEQQLVWDDYCFKHHECGTLA